MDGRDIIQQQRDNFQYNVMIVIVSSKSIIFAMECCGKSVNNLRYEHFNCDNVSNLLKPKSGKFLTQNKETLPA